MARSLGDEMGVGLRLRIDPPSWMCSRAMTRERRVSAQCFCSSSRALHVKEVGKAICDVMCLSQDESLLCRPQPPAGKLDLFPLPAADIIDDPPDPFFSFKALAFGASLVRLRVSYDPATNPTAFRVQKKVKGSCGVFLHFGGTLT